MSSLIDDQVYFTWYTFERPLHFLTPQEVGALDFATSCSTQIF